MSSKPPIRRQSNVEQMLLIGVSIVPSMRCCTMKERRPTRHSASPRSSMGIWSHSVWVRPSSSRACSTSPGDCR